MAEAIDFDKFPKIRNREQARAFEKVLRKSGKSEDKINELVAICKNVTKIFDAEGLIKFKDYLVEGDQVKLKKTAPQSPNL